MQTPLRQDLRRSVLMSQSATKNQTPLRRSLGSASPAVLLQHSNDEKERSERRSAVAMKRKLDNINTSTSSPNAEVHSFLGETQMKDHLNICTKLFTENKITTSNAWQLHVIDIVRKITSGEDTNSKKVLQIGGSNLDVGVKVYSVRVDDIHARGLQLASSIARTNLGAPGEIEDAANEEGGLDGQNKEKRTRNKRKKLTGNNKSTLEEDPKHLFGLLKRLECSLFNTKENIDISATENLFTYKLRRDLDTQDLMLMSDKKFLAGVHDMLLDEKKPITFELSTVSSYFLCEPFRDFDVCEHWDPDEEDKQLNIVHSNVEEAVLDDAGLPIAELDGSTHDLFPDNNEAPDTDEEEYHEDFQLKLHGEVANIVDAIPEDDRVLTDYGYNDVIRTSSGKYIDKLWAGPYFWKIKFNRRSAPRYSGASTQQVAKCIKKPKACEPIDFSADGARVFDKKNKLIVKRAPATLPFEKITLPIPQGITDFYKEVNELQSKPGCPRPKLNGKRNNANCDVEDVAPYNYENLNDSQYCSQQNDDDGGDNEPLQNSFEDNENAVAQMNEFLGDNLVDAPTLVSSSQVPYAMQAKKMDMKKLKTAVWRRITLDCPIAEENPKEATFEPLLFSKLYEDLPNYLNAEMKKELSCPLAFVALLHLCNDYNLKLEQDTKYEDFLITKAKG